MPNKPHILTSLCPGQTRPVCASGRGLGLPNPAYVEEFLPFLFFLLGQMWCAYCVKRFPGHASCAHAYAAAHGSVELLACRVARRAWLAPAACLPSSVRPRRSQRLHTVRACVWFLAAGFPESRPRSCLRHRTTVQCASLTRANSSPLTGRAALADKSCSFGWRKWPRRHTAPALAASTLQVQCGPQRSLSLLPLTSPYEVLSLCDVSVGEFWSSRNW